MKGQIHALTSQIHALTINNDKTAQEMKHMYERSVDKLKEDYHTQLAAQMQDMSSRYDAALHEQEASLQASYSASYSAPYSAIQQSSDSNPTASQSVLEHTKKILDEMKQTYEQKDISSQVKYETLHAEHMTAQAKIATHEHATQSMINQMSALQDKVNTLSKTKVWERGHVPFAKHTPQSSRSSSSDESNDSKPTIQGSIEGLTTDETGKTVKFKESDHLRLASLPTVTGYRKWKLNMKKKVASASGRPDPAFIWLNMFETAKT